MSSTCNTSCLNLTNLQETTNQTKSVRKLKRALTETYLKQSSVCIQNYLNFAKTSSDMKQNISFSHCDLFALDGSFLQKYSDCLWHYYMNWTSHKTFLPYLALDPNSRSVPTGNHKQNSRVSCFSYWSWLDWNIIWIIQHALVVSFSFIIITKFS